MDFRQKIEDQVLTIGRSRIPHLEKAVLRLLFKNFSEHSGKVTQQTLAASIAGFSAENLRQVRQVVHTLRVRHLAPILSDHHGYWIPHTPNDVQEFLRSLEHSARAEVAARFTTYKAMRESLGVRSQFFEDQAPLFDVVSSEKSSLTK